MKEIISDTDVSKQCTERSETRRDGNCSIKGISVYIFHAYRNPTGNLVEQDNKHLYITG
jgi:hypothetical protein